MAVLEDDLGSEQTLEEILELMSAVWDYGSGAGDEIMLASNAIQTRMQILATGLENTECDFVSATASERIPV